MISRSERTHRIDPNIGVGLEIDTENEIKFYTHHEPIEFSRIFYAACHAIPEQEIKMAINDYRCNNFGGEVIQGNLLRFQNECVKVWKEKMDLVLKYEHKRDRRSLSMVFGAISALSTLISAVKNSFEINVLSKRVKDFEARNERVLLDLTENKIKVAALSSYISSDLDRLSATLCGKTLSDTLLNSNNLANNMIESYLTHITHETLSVTSGEIPKTLDFNMDLKSLCTKFNEDDFCIKAINENSIQIRFQKAGLDEDMSLHIVMQVLLPIQSSKFKNSYPISISNVGFFQNETYYMLKLPSHALQTNEIIYGLNPDMCKGLICDVNAVYYDSNILCVSNLLSNHSDSCTATDFGSMDVCVFKRVAGLGYLMAIKNGLLSTNQNDLVEVNTLKSSNFWTDQSGHLICYQDNDQTSFLIMGQIMPYSATLKPKTQIITPKIDLSGYNFTFTESLNEKIERSIQNLTAKDDHVLVMGNEINTLLLISISGITSTAMALLVTNMQKFVTLIKILFAKIQNICHTKKPGLTIQFKVSRDDDMEEARSLTIQE